MKILVAVDVSQSSMPAGASGDTTSPQSDTAIGAELEQLDGLVGLKDSETTLLFVQEALPSFEAVMRTQGELDEDLDKQVEAAARQRLESVAARFKASGANVKVEIVHGPPAYMIEQVAKDEKSQLVVVAAGDADNKFLVGSTSQHVIRHAAASVLVLRKNRKTTGPVSRVLVAVDGSDQCLQAVSRAVDALNIDKGTLTINIVHVAVLSPMVASFTPQSFATALEENMLMEGEVALANAQKAFSDKGYKAVEIELGKGNAANEIIKMQDKYNSDLIVIGSQGKGAVKHFLMGHVANRVVTHASAPTVVAR